MKAAVQNGLLTLDSTLNDTQPFCASGNCTFPLYRSLAVCTRWEDVTSHLKSSTYEDKRSGITIGRWSLNNNSYIETGTDGPCVLNMSSVAKPKPVIDDSGIVNALDFGETIAFADNPYSIADVFVLYLNSSDLSNKTQEYHALEFVLEWCVQEYKTSVVNGTVYTTKEDSNHNFTGGFGYITGPLFNTTSQFGFLTSTPNYDVDNGTHFILSNYLRKVLNGSVYKIDADFFKTSDAAESFFQRINTDGDNEVVQEEDRGLTAMIEVMQNIATSMTNT
jgi:hypothetical protein